MSAANAVLVDGASGAPSGRGDAMLILYGDSVRAKDTAPLAALQAFLREHVGDAFGRLHLLPFFPSSSDDGFAVVDYRRVDHALGGWGHIEEIARDYEPMFDLVLNHCSREHLWFADFVSGRDPGRHYFITLSEGSDTSRVVRPRSSPVVTNVPTYAGIRHVWTTFSADQVDLNFANPDVLFEMADILLFYVERGARLVRLDAVAFLWKRLGTSCMSLQETHVVVKILRVLLERLRVAVTLITETNVPHAENISYFGAGDEAHAVYQFPLAPLMLHSYLFGDATAFSRWGAALEPPPPGCSVMNFIASHDGIGLRPLEGLLPAAAIDRLVGRIHERGGFVAMRDAGGGQERPYELNITLFSAFGGERSNLPAFIGAHQLLVALQGWPGIYLQALLARPNDLQNVERTGRTRSINRGYLDLDELRAELADDDSISAIALHAITRALRVRAELPALAASVPQAFLQVPAGVIALRRDAPTGAALWVIASVRDERQRVELATLGMPPGNYVDRLTGAVWSLEIEMALPPFATLWLMAAEP
ncbi:MAG: alpha-amylase family glycosyl hydrolase [Pseudomonadota bacterium]